MTNNTVVAVQYNESNANYTYDVEAVARFQIYKDETNNSKVWRRR